MRHGDPGGLDGDHPGNGFTRAQLCSGALSVLGLLLSLAALIISVFSVGTRGKVFFKITLSIVVFGVLLVNDGLRIWDPLDLAIGLKWTLYGLAFCVALICLFIAMAKNRD